VVGPDGAALPGATVRLTGGQGTVTMVTGNDGAFNFVLLNPGGYTVRADLQGFQSAEGTIAVSAGGRAEVELRLGEAIGEEILVTGEVPLVNKYNVSAGGAVGQEELNTIPTTARGAIQALAFLPGTVNDSESLRFDGYQPDIEGLTGSRAAYFVDGVDVSMPRIGGATRLQVPIYATAEVAVESSGIDAQYSRTIGGVVTMTIKSGTNDFHGELAWYGRNMDWDSNYDLTPVLQPDELKSSWEASFGGPIARDKLWFFIAYGDASSPGSDVLADGTAVDTGATMEQTIAKLDWRPGASHSFNVGYLATPFKILGYSPQTAEPASTVTADWPGEFYNANWNWAVTDSLFMEVHAASQDQETSTVPVLEKPIDPSADPWKPAGNNHVYMDFATGLLWAAAAPPGVGLVRFPRDQANVSLNWFLGPHDIKAGLDYQHVEWQQTTNTRDMAIGIGYNPDAPGGFARPLFFREIFNPPEGVTVTNDADSWAVFVRDRISVDRWTFNLGLRFDNQKHANDLGETLVDADVVSPRLSAVYDLRGDGRLLLSATAGRYMYQLPQNWTANFNTFPNGARDFYNQYGWNPGTRAYDFFMFAVPPVAEAVQQVDPHSKDEFTLGVDWSFHPDWAFKAKYLYWEQKDHATLYNQLDAQGTIVKVAEQNPYSESQRDALHLTVQRRFKDNWMVAAAYTWSKTEGNCQEQFGGDVGCAETGEYIDVVNPDTGVPWSLENKDGPLPTDRPHVFKLRGMYRLPLGRGHSLNLGGFFFLNSGQPWNRIEVISILGGRDTLAHFVEPRGSQRTPDIKQLSLNLEWQFPIAKRLEAGLKVDVINVTDEQELVGTQGLSLTGEPTLVSLNYQKPRYIRLMARLTF
jgi:hypothetical protein